MRSDPYCGNCGYSLRGLTDSSKCPECGKPIVEVLQRDRSVPRGKRYRSETVLFGLPLVHIALGPYEDETRGKARGIIAIGDIATGWLAIGGMARGLIAIGGCALGLFAIGGLAVGLLALGGAALGGAVAGGGAVGVIANGGGAVGYVADGAGAAGYYARGAGAYAKYAVDWRRRDPQAVALFDELGWLLASQPGTLGAVFPLCIIAGGTLIGACCTLLVVIAYLRRTPETEYR